MWIKSKKLLAMLEKGNSKGAILEAKLLLAKNSAAMATWSDLAGVLWQTGQHEAAISCLDQAIKKFDHYLLFNIRAFMHSFIGEHGKSVVDLNAAEQRSPGSELIRCNLAVALMAQGKNVEAKELLERIIKNNATSVSALENLAIVCLRLNFFDEALEHGRRWHSLQPQSAAAYIQYVYLLQSAGELDELSQVWNEQRLRQAYDNCRTVQPFMALSQLDDPLFHRHLAKKQAVSSLTLPSIPTVGKPTESRRIRIAYWSNDFYQHATLALLGEVLEMHDRERFEIFCLSYARDKSDSVTDNLRRNVEHFHDMGDLSDRVALEKISALDIDILVDLKGYTSGSRVSVPAARPARIVVSWLGYPGTIGSKNFDYVLGDSFVTPASSQQYYDETIWQLPNCYQPNDRRRRAAEPKTRTQYGLPVDAVVLAAFNATYKITPTIVSAWANVLKEHSNACLWLYARTERIFGNIKSAITAYGAAAEQVIFAPPLPGGEHLARYQVADMALDCFPYGAHTTGSDALRNGCPLVAIAGKSFASRVSASLLHAARLEELITNDFDTYETLIGTLIRDKARRQRIKEHLADWSELPLFDTPSFVSDLEAAYAEMWRRHVGS